jgi:prophage regulatory protein
MKEAAMRLIRLKTVLDRTGLSRSVVYDLMGKGVFPKPAKAYSGARANVWPEPEIDAWVSERIAAR